MAAHMDQLTVPTPLVPAEAPSGVMAKLGALPMATRMKLGMGVAALAAVVVAVSLWANQGDWKVLFWDSCYVESNPN